MDIGGDRLPVAKVEEFVGTSSKSFDDALNQAIKRASKTVRGIRGVDIMGHKVLIKNGKITEYRVHLKLSFGVE